MYERDMDHEAPGNARQWGGLAFFVFSTNFSSLLSSFSCISVIHRDTAVSLADIPTDRTTTGTHGPVHVI